MDYSEKTCEICHGFKGCFNVEFPRHKNVQVCSTSDALAEISRLTNVFQNITRVRLTSLLNAHAGALYKKGREIDENALDTGYFVDRANTARLPKDF